MAVEVSGELSGYRSEGGKVQPLRILESHPRNTESEGKAVYIVRPTEHSSGRRPLSRVLSGMVITIAQKVIPKF